ncbi:hypothetical protein GCM10023322_64490 [Rugosimonospora acidiphila]|uniref:DUF112 domain-containing protein n=1 Tax=Rugosimonospora acidiphila TaxID=556531 RepID=A0ABP9SKB2_9ACTN
MLHNLVHGLTALNSGSAIAYLVLGSVLGVFIGVIPGLGGSVVLSIVLSLAYHIDLTGTLCLFLGAHAGSYFSASVTSILLNTPAHPEAFAVTFDGFPMARNGRPGRALGISAASTMVGGVIGCLVLIGFVQIIDRLPNLFHPPEYVALVLLAVILVGTLGSNSVAKPLISAGLGIMVASVGPSLITGTYRYTFNQVGLYGGISLVAVALGAFAIPQMAMVFGTATTTSKQDMTGKDVGPAQQIELGGSFGRQVLGGIAETFRHKLLLLQSGLVGSLAGIVPGIGGFAANFMSYGIAQQTVRKRKGQWGTGLAEGIIAPEGSSLAKEAGSLVPIIGLGIPGSVGGSLFIAALTIKGIKTGYGFSTSYPSLPYEMVWILALSGILGTIIGVIIAPILARVTKVPGPILVPFILALAVLGPFLASVEYFTVYEVFVFGILGLLLRRLRYSLASFVIGLVLGPTFENNVYLTHNVYSGFSFLTARPAADVIFLIAILVLVVKVVQIRLESRRATATLASTLTHIDDPQRRIAVARDQIRRDVRFPLLSVIMTGILIALSVFFVVYGWQQYDLATKLMPIIGGVLVAIPAIIQLPNDIRRYVLWRGARNAPSGMAEAPSDAPDGGSEAAPVPEPEPVLVGGRRGSVLSAVANGPQGTLGAQPALATAVAPGGIAAIRENAWGRHGQYTREFMTFVWLFALVAVCFVFGFLWGIPAFCLAYGMTCTRRFIKTLMFRAVFSVLSAAGMWLLTYEALKFAHIVYLPQITL